MTGNERIIDRLLEAIAAYKAGQSSLAELQASLLSHGNAIEGAPQGWLAIVDSIEADLESVQFTVPEEMQQQRALGLLSRLENELRGLR